MMIDRLLADKADRILTEFDLRNARTRMDLSPDLPQQVYAFPTGTVVLNSAQGDRSRAHRFGMCGPVSDETLDEVEQLFGSREITPHFSICPFGDTELTQKLCGRGYRLFLWMQVLVRELTDLSDLPPLRLHPSLSFETITEDQKTIWAETLGLGFEGFPVSYVQDPEIHYPTPCMKNTTCSLARWEGEPVAAAALTVMEDWGYLYIAGTRKDFRCRGIQSALIHRRLQQAQQQGCSHAMIVVMPGSDSNRNSARAGFHVAYSRPLFKRDIANISLR